MKTYRKRPKDLKMAIPTIGEMVESWSQIREWKRWLLCLLPIVGMYLIGWASTLSLFFPIAYLKAADYLIVFPGIVSILPFMLELLFSCRAGRMLFPASSVF